MRFKDLKERENINVLSLVENSLWLKNKNLTSLYGSPIKIKGYFDCSHNFLSSLAYSPIEVDGGFNCSNNKLLTLKSRLNIVNGTFNCSNNNLKNLEGIKIKCYDFFCDNNNLISLKNNIREIENTFSCTNNPQLKNQKKEIIKNKIKAKYYKTDEGDFTFEEIEPFFSLTNKKNKIKEKIFNNNDYGLSL